MQVPVLGGNHRIVYVDPATEDEEQHRQRIFHKGRWMEYICSPVAICRYFVGGYFAVGSAVLAYTLDAGMTNQDPDSLWGRINATVIDYIIFDGAAVPVQIALTIFTCAGIGSIIKTCHNGIKEGRLQRNQSPHLEEENASIFLRPEANPER